MNEGLCSSWKPSVELLRAAINDAATSDLIKHAADWFEVLQILRRFEKECWACKEDIREFEKARQC